MTLVPADTPTLTADEALTLTQRIRQTGAVLSAQFAKAHAGRVWIGLGYSSWDEWFESELGDLQFRLPRAERQVASIEMAAEGMSTRAIGRVLGVDHVTVARDISGVANATPAPVSGEGVGHHVVPDRPAPSPEPDDEIIEAEIVEPPAPREVIGRDGKTYTVRPRPEAAVLTEFVDSDADVQLAAWRRNFAKALESLSMVALYDPETVVDKWPDLDDLAGLLAGLDGWGKRIAVLRTRPLRSISGGKS